MNVVLPQLFLAVTSVTTAAMPQTAEPPAFHRWVVLGSPAAPQVIAGVAGDLTVAPQLVLPWTSRRSVFGVLEELALDDPGRLGQRVHYQMFELTTGGAVLLPQGSFPEEGGQRPGAERDRGGSSLLSDSDVVVPLAPTVELTLRRDIGMDALHRHLTFSDHNGNRRRLRMTLTRVAGTRRFVATAFPDGITALTGMTVTNVRRFWDRMSLENITGITELDIGRVRIVMNYGNDVPSGGRQNITVVNRDLDQVLGANPASVSLDLLAVESRKAWGGITADMPWCMQLAAEDLGKSGSDGDDDLFGRNPKYGNSVDNLCSEFVSWYYYQSSYVIGGHHFRDVTLTEQLDDIFTAAGRLYSYHSGRQRFEHVGSGAVYQPRAGDFLERRGEHGAEHSMLVISWNDVTKVATVINGPWPVTVRTVDVQDLEINGGKDFRIGRLRVP